MYLHDNDALDRGPGFAHRVAAFVHWNVKRGFDLDPERRRREPDANDGLERDEQLAVAGA